MATSAVERRSAAPTGAERESARAAASARVAAQTGAPAPATALRRTGARLAGLVVALAVLGLAVLLSVAVGSRQLPLGTVLDVLLGAAPAGDPVAVVVLEQRVPRTALALAVGAALGVAGALVQAVTRNPLADPGILGVSAGAGFAVAVAVGVLGVTAASGYVWFALAGALVAAVLVHLVGAGGGAGGGSSPVRLTLTGVALGAVLSGISSALVLTDPQRFQAVRSWESGALADRGWEGLATTAPLLLLGLLAAAAIAPALNAVALGDDLATSLGVPVALVRAVALGSLTLLAGGATAAAGPISFVGLMVPHVARWVVGPDQRWILAYTVVLAPVLLLAADVVGRVVMRPGELPAGLVTAVLGAPVLVVLVRRRRATAL